MQSVPKPLLFDSREMSPNAERMQAGLAKLVLTIVDVLRDLLERQALRRVEHGTLSKLEIENLGKAFINIRQRIEELCQEFGFEPDDLNLDLGPIGQLKSDNSNQVSLVDVLDKVIDQGTVVVGELMLSVAGIDLIALNLLLSLTSVQSLESIKSPNSPLKILNSSKRLLK